MHSEVDWRAAVWIKSALVFAWSSGFRFRPGARRRRRHVRPTFDGIVGATQMQIVLVDESFGHFDERDFAGKPAIIPPVGLERGDVIFAPGVIDGGNHKVGARYG